MKPVIALLLCALLGACSGMLAGTKSNPTGTTFASIEKAGEVEGVSVADGKDRQSFDTGSRTKESVGCEPGVDPRLCRRVEKEFWLKTADSNGSNAQAAALETQARSNHELTCALRGTMGVLVPLAAAGAKVAGLPVPPLPAPSTASEAPSNGC
ncbi:MAG: hypothetical protein U1E45_15010 [Geminicoccaceae bacterium]